MDTLIETRKCPCPILSPIVSLNPTISFSYLQIENTTMEKGGSSRSNSVSSVKSYSAYPPHCFCGKRCTILKSWTCENPGRRFLRCELHGFSKWVDEEPPHGWQKESLLEARDEIWRLKYLIRTGKGDLGGPSKGLVNMEELGGPSKGLLNAGEQQNSENKIMRLKVEIAAGKEREKMLSQFIVLSWGCFVVAMSVMVFLLK